ncbi:MAG: sulfotransferase domain-containing protein [Pirellulales bacterium]|nr:sulfotransferase domain-containing protein [Pirellulales bacterium]
MSGIIWLASYPKSGNTWLRAFLHNLLAPGDESYSINALDRFSLVDNNHHLFDPFIDKPLADYSLEEIAQLRPRVHERIARQAKGTAYVKTHNMLVDSAGTPMITPAFTAGAIYIARNPLDVAVSYSHHLDRSIDETIDVLNRDGQLIEGDNTNVYSVQGSWRQNVMSWTHKAHPSMHVVRYEDLHERAQKTFAGIARFLRIDANKAAIAKAIADASFTKLKAQEEASGFVEKAETTKTFFRSGAVGEWKETLTDAQRARIVEANAEVMQRFDYEGR